MQSWLGYSIFSNPPNSTPPKSVPVSRLSMTGHFQKRDLPVVALFATDGANSWVGMPKQDLGFGFVPSTKWIAAPAETPAAFRGEVAAQLVPTTKAPTQSATPTEKSSSSSDSSKWPIVVAVVAVLALLVLIAVGVRSSRRSKKHDDE